MSGVTDSLERARPSDRTDEEGGCRGGRPPWRSVVRPAGARRDLRCQGLRLSRAVLNTQCGSPFSIC